DFARYIRKSVEVPSLIGDYLETGDRQRFERELAAINASPVGASRATGLDFIAAHADAIFVSGVSEGKRVREDFPAAAPVEVVKLGFNRPVGYEHASRDAFVSRYGVEDFVLCVGRLETRKNQLMLLYALQDDDIPVVFVNSDTIQPEYEALCRRFERKGKTIFTGRIGREMLFSAYKAAKVHALPSWYELPGLVSLEACWCGCNVVASEWGTIGEYLEGHGTYCEPGDPDSIRRAVLAAMAADPGEDGRRILEMRTWENVADRVHTVYDRILRDHQSKSALRLRARRSEAARKEAEYHQLMGKAVKIVEKNPGEALEILRRISQYGKSDPGIDYVKGIASLLSMGYGDAERHFADFLGKRSFPDVKVSMYLAIAQMKGGHSAAAVETLTRALRANPFCTGETGNILREQLKKALQEEAADQSSVMTGSK
ncbi:MAG: glycosyltransferase, partial [Deltaproteobacteria bacterium]|nr:glycosyltransferase [Deltaproteobacteria bacterium]